MFQDLLLDLDDHLDRFYQVFLVVLGLRDRPLILVFQEVQEGPKNQLELFPLLYHILKNK